MGSLIDWVSGHVVELMTGVVTAYVAWRLFAAAIEWAFLGRTPDERVLSETDSRLTAPFGTDELDDEPLISTNRRSGIEDLGYPICGNDDLGYPIVNFESGEPMIPNTGVDVSGNPYGTCG